MNRWFASMTALLLVAGACDDEEDPPTPGTQTALETPYDNASSLLGAENVQDGIDELAARPIAEASLGPRLVLIEAETPNPGGELVSASANCPDLEHDVALGGSCFVTATPNLTLVTTSMGEAGYGCQWRQGTTNTDPLHVTVRCLRNAR